MSIAQKIKRKLHLFQNDLLYKSNVKKHQPKAGGLILNYHGVDQVGDTRLNSRFISQAYFEQQLQYFKTHCHVLPLFDYMEGKWEQGKLNLALTFDDGYLNNFTYVLPLLEKYKAPASFYITGIVETDYDYLWCDFLDIASFVYQENIEIEGETYKKGYRGLYKHATTGRTLKSICAQSDFAFKEKTMQAFPEAIHEFRQDKKWNDYWQQMSKTQIQEAAKSSYITIGSHAYWHNDLSQINLNDATKELQQSKDFLENLVQQEVNELAYPHGGYSDTVVEKAETMGFKYQLTLDYNNKENKYKCLEERFGINPYISWNNQLHFLLRGDYV